MCAALSPSFPSTAAADECYPNLCGLRPRELVAVNCWLTKFPPAICVSHYSN